MKNYIESETHTTTLEENFGLFSISPKILADSRDKIIQILEKKGLIKKVESKQIITTQEIENYIIFLLESRKLNKQQYIQIFLNSGAIMLGEYLIYKGIITQNEHKKALDIQKKENKKYGEILLEKNIIKDNKYSEYSIALQELGIIRLGEYYLGNGTISPHQLNMFLKIQKVKNKAFGQILIDFNIITKEELEKVLYDILGIKINYDKLGEDDIYSYYKLK